MKFLILFLISTYAFADGFYLEGGIAAMQNHNFVHYQTMTVVDEFGNQSTIHADRYHSYDINETRNPYGSYALGYDFSFKRLTFDIRAQHQSSIAVSDHGENIFKFSLRWYPFSPAR